MTPIDWKQLGLGQGNMAVGGRQSLVTPIDWKLHPLPQWRRNSNLVANLWCRLLIGNRPMATTCETGLVGRQTLVTPIDWKLCIKRTAQLFSIDLSLILGDAY